MGGNFAFVVAVDVVDAGFGKGYAVGLLEY